MKKILMIATGGTIASVPTDSGLAPGLTAKELLAFVPKIRQICEAEVIQPYSIDSTNVTVRNWQTLVKTVEENYESYDGFVISHGTDTLAYTAAALSFMIQRADKPIVLTGSQLPIGEEGTDAVRNLNDAFLYAADPGAEGVSVVFCGRVIDGLRARKMCTKSFDAFASINAPEIAQIRDGRIIRKEDTAARDEAGREVAEKPKFYYEMNPDVCVLKLTPDLAPSVFRWVLEHVAGVILEGFGSGGIPEYLNDVFYAAMELRWQKGYLTMMGTQAFYEGTDLEAYEVGKAAKMRTGMEECKDMTVEAAVAWMMWILGHGETESLPLEDGRKE